MAFQTKSEHSTLSEINVTPLVDVMLVLMVVFLVTAPLMVQSIPVELPKTAPATPITDTHHTDLAINADEKIYIDGRPVEMEALEKEMSALAQSNPAHQVQIQADHSIPFGKVAQILALVQHAGIRQLSVVTQEQ